MSGLWLAEAEVRTSRYMDDRRAEPERVLRLVWAASAEEAEEKLRAALEVDDPYGTSRSVWEVRISAAIS